VKMKRSERLILIRPSTAGGVHDFAETLARALRCDRGLEVSVSDLGRRLRVPLQKHDIAWVQYSGYGYAKRGAPLWLIGEIEGWRQRGVRVGVNFHELFAMGPPWTSSFWLSPIQRSIARRLVELSEFWTTNRELSARWLNGGGAERPHAVMPVFSNVGEATAYSKDRHQKVVIFGSAEGRLAVYRAIGEPLFRWVRERHFELHDIGAPVGDVGIGSALAEAGAVIYGRVTAERVGAVLRDALLGILAYPVEYVAKSSVFAAYCAHGVSPVLVSKRRVACDGLHPGVQYVPHESLESLELASLTAVGERAWAWYQDHSVQRHAQTVQRLSGLVGGPAPAALQPVGQRR
jgi:hypothetical protein